MSLRANETQPKNSATDALDYDRLIRIILAPKQVNWKDFKCHQFFIAEKTKEKGVNVTSVLIKAANG